MKVFWSWQSDHPGKISRHFVREALEEAIVALQQDPDIQEAARDAELDHDRKGVPGSPDLANVILNKIGQSDVIVADVTPVGNVLGNTNKRLINSNVAIELGYALSALSDRALLMILNEAYGTRDDLPFDLKHKAGPIIYRLESSASKSKISNEKLSLAGKLKTALREMLKFPKKNEPAFIEVQFCDANPGRFFQKEEVLAVRNDIEYSCISDGLVYIRIIPISIMPELSRVEAMQAAISGKLGVLDDRASGWSTARNKYGVLVFESDSDARKIISATQLFKSREIWGFDASMLSSERARRGIPTGWHEVMIAKGLHKYLTFAVEVLNMALPLTVEIGLTNVSGYVLNMDDRRYPWDPHWGPIHDEHIIYRERIDTRENSEVDAVLLKAFEKIFDAAGTQRPEKYNSFPGPVPGSSPRS